MKLNISQVTLAKLAQSGKHQSRSQEVQGSIPIGGKIFCLKNGLYCQCCQLCIIKGKRDKGPGGQSRPSKLIHLQKAVPTTAWKG